MNLDEGQKLKTSVTQIILFIYSKTKVSRWFRYKLKKGLNINIRNVISTKNCFRELSESNV